MKITFFDPAVQATLGLVTRLAMENVCGINAVRANISDHTRHVFRAGVCYSDVWTRDGSYNCWMAGSLLWPEAAKDTLEHLSELSQDEQEYWDHIIWVIAAWHHFLVTRDESFLAMAHAAGVHAFEVAERRHFDASRGLFQGPAHICDGMGGYPSPPFDPTLGKSHVTEHLHTDRLLCLSTNCLHVKAYRCLARMEAHLGRGTGNALRQKADALREAINTHF